MCLYFDVSFKILLRPNWVVAVFTRMSGALYTLGKIQFVCNTVNIQIITLPFKYARSTSLGNGPGSLVLDQTVREYEMLTWMLRAAGAPSL